MHLLVFGSSLAPGVLGVASRVHQSLPAPLPIEWQVGRSFDLACIPLWATLSDHTRIEVSRDPSATFILRNGSGFVQLENSVITGLAETSQGVVQAAYAKKSAFIRVSVDGIP